MYRRLASALHPDREPDPAMAQRKTALMASVNQAYDKKDLLGLLALQVDLAHIDARSLASASQDQLASYNLLLQGQLREAEREIEQQCASLRRRFCVPPLQALAPTDLLPLVQARVLAARNAQYDVQQGVAALADLPRLRAWLKTLKT